MPSTVLETPPPSASPITTQAFSAEQAAACVTSVVEGSFVSGGWSKTNRYTALQWLAGLSAHYATEGKGQSLKRYVEQRLLNNHDPRFTQDDRDTAQDAANAVESAIAHDSDIPHGAELMVREAFFAYCLQEATKVN